MVEAHYLTDVRALRVALDVDLDGLHVRAGDFIERELETTLLDANAPRHLVQSYLDHARGRKTIVFTPTVALAHEMVTAFTAAGIASDAVEAATPVEERRAMLQRFRHGTTQVLANCGVLTEGYDEPSASRVAIARPTRSRVLYTQMIGRGLRPSPGKPDCLVLDVVGATTRHDLVTATTLFGTSTLGQGLRAALAAARSDQASRRAVVDVDGQLVTSAVDLLHRHRVAIAERRCAWVPAGPGRFVLAGQDEQLLLVQAGEERWSVVRHPRGGAPEILRTGISLEWSMGIAEDHVRRSGAARLAERAAAWRSHPATDKQREALRRCRLTVDEELTKGKAADMLTGHFARRVRV